MVARGIRPAWALALISLGVAVVVVPVAGTSPGLTAVFVCVPQAAAAITVVLRARGERGARSHGWRLLAVAILAYSWTTAFYIADPDAAKSFPGLGDVSVVTYPALLAALALFWRVRAPQGTRSLMLDAAIAGLALAALVEWLVIAPRVGGSQVGLTAYGQVVYATGDSFLLGFLLAGLTIVEWPPARAAPWLGLGLALMSASDTAFAARVSSGEIMPPTFTQLGWAAAMVALAGAAAARPRREMKPPLRLGAVIVPATAAAIAVPVVLVWRPNDDVARLVIATMAVVLAGLRLVLSLAENIRLVAVARTAEARQEALAELGGRALEQGDLGALLTDGARLAGEGVGAEYAAVLERRGDAGVCLRAAYGWPAAVGEIVPGSSPAELATRSGEPVVVADWLKETRFALPAPLRALGARSGLSVALPSRKRGTWALSVHSREPRAYDPGDTAFLEAVANVLATAVDRLDASEYVRELAAVRGRLIVQTLESEERERRRIAEGLHDLALQEVLAARQELDEIEGEGGSYVIRARQGLARAVRDLREAVTELHPIVLEHAGFQAALEALASRQAARAGFDYELDVDAGAAWGNEEVLVSLARELLANVARHAGASHVTASVTASGRGVALDVRDDGCGADAEAIAAAARVGHIGLASWTERIEALGGTLTVRTPADGGTWVRAELPEV